MHFVAKRVDVARRRVIHEGLEVHLADDACAWVRQPDGSYAQGGTCEAGRHPQERLLERCTPCPPAEARRGLLQGSVLDRDRPVD